MGGGGAMKRLIDSAGNARQSASSKPLAARKEIIG
jgi:hypothetical protein